MPNPSDFLSGYSTQGQYGSYGLFGGSAEGTTPLSNVRQRYRFGDVNTPQLFASFAREQLGPEGAISRAADARRRGAIEGATGSFFEAQRQIEDETRYAGVPAYIARRRAEQLYPAYESAAAKTLAESDAQEQEDIFNLLGSTVSSIASATEFALGLDFQKYQIKKAEDAAKRANRLRLIGSLVQSAGALLGGPLGGKLFGGTPPNDPFSSASEFAGRGLDLP